MSKPANLPEWLAYQQRVHPREVDLGLARVREIFRRLGAGRPAPVVITVGGTNGKGSTVAFLESMLAAASKKIGTYTSPHLLRYNERIRIDGKEAADAALVDVFARIEAVRGEISLTYFEFATLAALLIFAESELDVAVLEVGLGGALDAVNLIDADVSIVTTVDLDHREYLGDDRNQIGREKAGIFRNGRPAIIGDATPVKGLVDEATRIGADIRMAGRDFHVEIADEGWRWRSGTRELALPAPGLIAGCQHANAAAAIAALDALSAGIGWDPEAIARGVAGVQLDARLQRFNGRCEWLIDVAHNPQAASVLAQWLHAHPRDGDNIAVFSALADKDIGGIVTALDSCFVEWHLAGMARESPRGLDVVSLRAPVEAALGKGRTVSHETLADALEAAHVAAAGHADRVVAFGSFFVAAAALDFARQHALESV
ncbi:MAG: bifunctional tetrahydrofolate synthase/dihydrofolate synthase [Rhodanobacteraceae bacterium]